MIPRWVTLVQRWVSDCEIWSRWWNRWLTGHRCQAAVCKVTHDTGSFKHGHQPWPWAFKNSVYIYVCNVMASMANMLVPEMDLTSWTLCLGCMSAKAFYKQVNKEAGLSFLIPSKAEGGCSGAQTDCWANMDKYEKTKETCQLIEIYLKQHSSTALPSQIAWTISCIYPWSVGLLPLDYSNQTSIPLLPLYTTTAYVYGPSHYIDVSPHLPTDVAI